MFPEPVTWPGCNLAVSQTIPYFASVNSTLPRCSQSAVRLCWPCMLCEVCIQNKGTSRSASSWQCACPFYCFPAGFFLAKRHTPKSVSPPAAQMWLRASSVFKPKLKSPLNGRRFSMRHSHSTQAESSASHCSVASPTGEWLFMDVQ